MRENRGGKVVVCAMGLVISLLALMMNVDPRLIEAPWLIITSIVIFWIALAS